MRHADAHDSWNPNKSASMHSYGDAYRFTYYFPLMPGDKAKCLRSSVIFYLLTSFHFHTSPQYMTKTMFKLCMCSYRYICIHTHTHMHTRFFFSFEGEK